MYESILEQAGLTTKEAIIYEKLLELGPSSVGSLLKATPYKRGDLYNILYALRDKDLVNESLKRGVTVFTLEDPKKLDNLVVAKQQQVEVIKTSLREVSPDIYSKYNLSLRKPGVRFLEGIEGVRTAGDDSLRAVSEIYSYVDVEAVERYIPDYNREFVKERTRLGKKKRILVTDSPYNRAYFEKLGPQVTDVRFIDFELSPFQAVMQVYDNKVAYVTLDPDRMITIMIQDAHIAQMQRSLFEYTWSTGTSTGQTTKPQH